MKPAALRNVLIVLLACILGLGGIAYCGRAMYWAWQGDDCDLKSRGEEYADFSKQIYPNCRLQLPDNPRASAHTVYPPYALPMFTVFFGFCVSLGRISRPVGRVERSSSPMRILPMQR